MGQFKEKIIKTQKGNTMRVNDEKIAIESKDVFSQANINRTKKIMKEKNIP